MSLTASGAARGRNNQDDGTDLWRTAYASIKRDPDNEKLLSRFDSVVRVELGESRDALRHLGSTEGRQRLLGLIDSKAQNLSTGDGTLGQVVQAVLKTKDIVSTGAVASPPAALAVAGLFIALSMGQNYLKENRAMADCAAAIARIIFRRAVEDSQIHVASPQEAEKLKQLRNELRSKYLDLYSKILTTVARLVVKLDSSVRRWADNLFSLTNWVDQRRTLDEAERECERDLEVIHHYRTDTSGQPSPFVTKGRNLLHENADLGNTSIVAQLVQSNAFDINARTNNGWTALSLAAEKGHLSCCKNILPIKGLDKNSRNNRGRTALHVAAHKDHADVVKLLFSSGVDVNIKDNEGRTALHIAAHHGQLNTIKQLRNARGIDLNAQDSTGLTPLHIATLNKHAQVVSALAEQGASLDTKTGKGRSPLLDATEAGSANIMQILILHGAAVNQVSTIHRWTPLHISAAAENLECLRILLGTAGIILNPQNDQGRTPLHEAVLKTQVFTVRELCDKGAQVDVRSNNQRTALLDAAKIGHLNIVKRLVEAGANVNQVSGKNGWSALHEAAFRNKVGVAEYLIEQGIDRGLKVKGGTQQGATARQMAEARGHAALLDIL